MANASERHHRISIRRVSPFRELPPPIRNRGPLVLELNSSRRILGNNWDLLILLDTLLWSIDPKKWENVRAEIAKISDKEEPQFFTSERLSYIPSLPSISSILSQIVQESLGKNAPVVNDISLIWKKNQHGKKNIV